MTDCIHGYHRDVETCPYCEGIEAEEEVLRLRAELEVAKSQLVGYGEAMNALDRLGFVLLLIIGIALLALVLWHGEGAAVG